jgi:Ras-related GTP-binding protein C/D
LSHLTSDEHKVECQNAIHHNLSEALLQEGDADMDAQLTFHATSIYDHSIFEAMSKVIQKLIPELPALEQLLDMLVTNMKWNHRSLLTHFWEGEA